MRQPKYKQVKTAWTRFRNLNRYEQIKNASNEEKLELAQDTLAGKCFTKSPNKIIAWHYKRTFHAWLSWFQSEDRDAVIWWHWVAEKKKLIIKKKEENIFSQFFKQKQTQYVDRDAYTIRFWHSMNKGDNSLAKQQAEDEITTWSYYEQHFFNWFLNRSNTVNARAVYTQTELGKYIHIPIAVVTLFIVICYFLVTNPEKPDLFKWICGIFSIGFIFLLHLFCSGMRLTYGLQSLIPRMAVTTGIGYLFLISTSGFVKMIYQSALLNGDLRWGLGVAIALILVVYLYMMQVLQRRVRPALSLYKTCQRAGNLLIMGVTYSAIGLLLTSPILFHTSFVNPAEPYIYPESHMYLLIIAAIALAIGVVLQLVWEDKPVTEPL